MKDYIVINPIDNVAVCLREHQKGEVVEGVTLLEAIPRAHKVALKDIKKGQDIIKYGSPIGHATKDIKVGEHVHTQNVATNLDDVITYKYEPNYPEVLGYKDTKEQLMFMNVKTENMVFVMNYGLYKQLDVFLKMLITSLKNLRRDMIHLI